MCKQHYKSKYKTWIELPPELRPAWWKNKFVQPVVLLVKALYGHPDAGGMWEQHLKGILKKMGGEEIPEFPGNFWFSGPRLMLSTYVDDLTLAGPRESHQRFWSELTNVVNVEPPEAIYRMLGRNHMGLYFFKGSSLGSAGMFDLGEAYPEAYPRSIPPKHTPKHTLQNWCFIGH